MFDVEAYECNSTVENYLKKEDHEICQVKQNIVTNIYILVWMGLPLRAQMVYIPWF